MITAEVYEKFRNDVLEIIGKGNIFEAEIPQFSLDSPFIISQLN